MTETPTAPDVANELARERNREAAERTLMAWIRTALSLIGFGFGIGKLAAYMEAAGLHTRFDVPHSSLIFGASFIVVGSLDLLAAIVQHARILKRLSRPDFADLGYPFNRSKGFASTGGSVKIAPSWADVRDVAAGWEEQPWGSGS